MRRNRRPRRTNQRRRLNQRDRSDVRDPGQAAAAEVADRGEARHVELDLAERQRPSRRTSSATSPLR
jgi:hypothetical protein